jgi:hypothetical protein
MNQYLNEYLFIIAVQNKNYNMDNHRISFTF